MSSTELDDSIASKKCHCRSDYSVSDKCKGKYTAEFSQFSREKSKILNEEVLKMRNTLAEIASIGTFRNWRMRELSIKVGGEYCTSDIIHIYKRGVSTISSHENARHAYFEDGLANNCREKLAIKTGMTCNFEDEFPQSDASKLIKQIMDTDTPEDVYKVFIKYGESITKPEYIRTFDGKKYAIYYKGEFLAIRISNSKGEIIAEIDSDDGDCAVEISYSFTDYRGNIKKMFDVDEYKLGKVRDIVKDEGNVREVNEEDDDGNDGDNDGD